MKFISEKQIEQAAAEIESLGEVFQPILDDIGEQQPMILSYLLSDNFKLLTDREREYLLYLTLVIWKAIQLAGEQANFVEEETIGSQEEQNWEKIEESKAKSFRDKLDVFFDAYPQEDLLALVEDALADDQEAEDVFITKIGREPMFIALKTIIDVLTAS